MKYLLDTANLDAIRYYTDIFPIAGVTSNPSIVTNILLCGKNLYLKIRKSY